MTYQRRRQKRSKRLKREQECGRAVRLGVRAVTGLKLRLRAGRRGADEQQQSADWSEPLRAGRRGEMLPGAPCVIRHLAKGARSQRGFLPDIRSKKRFSTNKPIFIQSVMAGKL